MFTLHMRLFSCHEQRLNFSMTVLYVSPASVYILWEVSTYTKYILDIDYEYTTAVWISEME